MYKYLYDELNTFNSNPQQFTVTVNFDFLYFTQDWKT